MTFSLLFLVVAAMWSESVSATTTTTTIARMCGNPGSLGTACQKLGTAAGGTAFVDPKTTVCIINQMAQASTYNLAGYECADVCDVNKNTSQFIIAAPGMENYERLNAAFIQMVVGVRGGNNGNVQCTDAPLWWRAQNHDWCHPGNACGGTANAPKVKPGMGRCVVAPGGPGGRACWDICDGKHMPVDYGEGARAGVVEEVLAARSDGTCSNSTTTAWLIFLLIFVCCIIIGVGGFFASRMGRGKAGKRGLGGGQPVDHAEQMMMDQPPMVEEAPYPHYPEPQPQPVQQPPLQQQQQPNTFLGLGEPKLPVPSLAPPPASFGQVPVQPYNPQAQYAGVHTGHVTEYAVTTGQPHYASNPMATQPPAAFSQGGYMYH